MTRARGLRWSLLAPAVLTSAAASAHGGAETPWTLDAWVMVPLVLSGAWFMVGAWRLARRSRLPGTHRRQWLWFGSGWLVLAAALLSPLHAAGARSFAAHMLEHELLMLAAAPLLVLGRPLGIALWALPHRARLHLGQWGRRGWLGQCWRRVSTAGTATALQLTALWIWHAPALFDRALRSDGWHIAQHLSFLVTALLFWHALLRRPRPGIAVACLFATALVSGALGGLMALSTSPWYVPYAELGMTPYGLSAAEDQQLAGLLMWVPGGLVHAVVALLLLGRVLHDTPAQQGWRSA